MKLAVLILIFFSISIPAQSIFEEAVSGEEQSGKDLNFELGGYIRASIFTSTFNLSNPQIISRYAEPALKLKVTKSNFGSAFAELRFKSGNEFNKELNQFDLREAYIDLFAGSFDFRIGKQIIAWGKADGFNPTDVITPKNFLIRSQNEDDRRLGNFLIKSTFTSGAVSANLIWVPIFESNVLPTEFIDLPSGLNLLDYSKPKSELSNSSLAAKLNLNLPTIDASLSYFSGYSPSIGMAGVNITNSIFLQPVSYKINSLGFDFSTTVANELGLRGEFAFINPTQGNNTVSHIPNSELSYVLGFDRDFGDLNIIVQYIGKTVLDFQELTIPQNPLQIPYFMVARQNRMLNSQLYKTTHSISIRPSMNLFYETVNVQLLALYNTSTKEIMMRPKLSYDYTDGLELFLGGEIYNGPSETLFGLIKHKLSSIFFEIKTSF